MRTVTGQLLFSEDVDGKATPIRNAFLQLWDLDIIKNDYLASGETDANGNFSIAYDPAAAGRWTDRPDLVLRLMDREYAYDKQGEPVSDWYVVTSFPGADNVTDDVYDFGKLRAAFWEYQSPERSGNVAFTPRVATRTSPPW